MPGRIEVAGITVVCDVVSHPLLGDAHLIEHAGRAITAITAIDWDHPERIPAIAEPGALPPNAGGALLNELARRAMVGGDAAPPLRYAGPYPTPGLYRALARSFRASAGEATFTKDLLARAATLARDEVAVDFTPAPHTRVANAHGHAEIRDGLERAVIDGVAYEREGVARFVDRAIEPTASSAPLDGARTSAGSAPLDGARTSAGRAPMAAREPAARNGSIDAEIWFGDASWARVATFDATGALIDGPHPVRPPTSDVIGKPFPPALLHALASLVGELVPLGLPVELPRVSWADLGARAARATADGYEVHAAMWERLAPHGMARLAMALAEALAPVVTMKLVHQLGRPR